MLDNVELVAAALDCEGRITFANAFLAGLTGWPAPQLLGRDWFETFDPPEMQGVREQFQASIAADVVTVHSENWILTRTGQRRLIAWTNTPLRDQADAVVGVMSIGEDVTERRAEEGALRNLVQEQSALRRVATLVAGGAEPDAVFRLATEVVAGLVGADMANLMRFEKDGTATVVAGWAEPGVAAIQLGSTLPLDDNTTIGTVARTGRSHRIDDYHGIPGELAALVRGLGMRSAVTTPITVGGRVWGAVAASTTKPEALPADAEPRISQFCDLLSLAIANAEAQQQLMSSRARIVTAGDRERRRLERNLHDGAQQRLVSLSIELRTLEAQLPDERKPAVAAMRAELTSALEELRELARGIHPATLSDYGLGPALEALRSRAPVPVTIPEELPGRLPAPVEAAAYYLVAEALTNVAKHAHARSAEVTLEIIDGRLRVAVQDDGVGGAAPAGESGLRGLRDRVEALGGQLAMASPAGGGTVVEALLPLAWPEERDGE